MCCIHITLPPVRIVVLQESLAVYCLARSYGRKTMDLPDDMQAVNHKQRKCINSTTATRTQHSLSLTNMMM